MNLGDLEFKTEDFIRFDNPTKKLMNPQDVQLAEAMAVFSAEQANRILRERLAKAPEVNCTCWNWERIHETGWYRGKGTSQSTHRARLVCIEELAKEHAKSDSSSMCVACGLETNACICEEIDE